MLLEEDDVGVHYTWKMESEESSAPQRRKRNTAKASPLDALSGASQPVPGSDHFTFSLGGAETGGPEAERVLREVEIDDDAISLRAQFARGRKVVLYAPNGKAVAAAVVEMHPSDAIFEVPILASARAHRQQGYGSVLVALLRELAIQLRCGMFVISATDESRQFWMRQGSDAAPVCDSMRRPLLTRPRAPTLILQAPRLCVLRRAHPDEAPRAQPEGRAVRLLRDDADGDVAPGDARGRARLPRPPLTRRDGGAASERRTR